MSWFENDEVVTAPRRATAPASPQPVGASQGSGAVRADSGRWWEQDQAVASPGMASLQPGAAPAGAPQASPAPQRSMLGEVGRQVGLGARYALEGTAQAAQIVTEPARHMVVNPALRAIGAPEAGPLAAAASRVGDALGLPTPETTQERVIGDASRLVAGAGLTMGAGAAAAAAPGMTGKAGALLASHPGQQVASAAGAGVAGGAVKEAGGDELTQAGAALVGGVGGGLASSMAVGMGRGVTQRLYDHRATRVDDQLAQALQRAGVDWDTVPERARQGLRAEVGQALRTGQDLNADALRRLLDFRQVEGSIPTRGALTLDPVQITRERNLAKTGANASDAGPQGLAQVENQNNAALVSALNRMGADRAEDAYAVGGRVMGSLQRGLDAERAGVNDLYAAARDSAGRSYPLDGASFTQAASRALDDALLGHALPPSVTQHLNRIAVGEVPFTVDYAQQLATTMGQLRRATSDGQTRLALDKVRQALDDTPVLGLGDQTVAAGARPVNPGNLPAVPGAPDLGIEAVERFNRARAANRTMMRRIEDNPALKAIYDGDATPDDFMRKFVLQGQGATVLSVRKLGTELKKDPEAWQAARGYLVAHLKDRATSGAADETARFSAMRYRAALGSIGDRKLAAFFAPEEIEQLKAIGRVATYTQHQPAGSAVNNSNSGALLLGRGIAALDAIASKVPLLGIGPQVTNITRGVQQRQAREVAGALVNRPAVPTAGERTVPAVTFGALFAFPGSDQRQDGERP